MLYFADCHSCLPLHGDTDFSQLRLHYNAGVRYVSINVGMDMNPLTQVMTTIAGFRRQISDNSDWLVQAETHSDIIRAFSENKLAISFDLEGALPLLEDINMVALYHRLGVRQIHLAYNRNNSIAGGTHDEIEQGLTRLGEQMVHEIHRCGILMDMSHNSEKTALDICAVSGNRPVLYSHANPRAIIDHGRSISDDVIKATAKTGGLIGLNGVNFLNSPNFDALSMVEMIEYVVDLVGVEHVAIGLDYCYDDGRPDIPEDTDRGYWWPVSAGYLPKKGLLGRYISPESLTTIAEHLAKRNYLESDIRAIMKDNILNLIQRIW